MTTTHEHTADISDDTLVADALHAYQRTLIQEMNEMRRWGGEPDESLSAAHRELAARASQLSGVYRAKACK